MIHCTGTDVVQTTDGGYFLCGGTWSGTADLAVFYYLRTDGEGNPLWSNTLPEHEYLVGCVQTNDGGYLVTGTVAGTSTGHRSDVRIYSIDPAGMVQWYRDYGTRDYNSVADIVTTRDGMYVLTGQTTTHVGDEFDAAALLVKIDQSGGLRWLRTFEGDWQETAAAAKQTDDNGFIVAGYSYQFQESGPTQSNVLLIKTDRNGLLY